jgi:thymidylate synthase
MKPYMEIVDRVLNEGVWKSNRTKYKALTIAGASATYDVSEQYPMLTLKKVPPKSCFGELVGFVKGVQSAADMRENGSKVWDQNANENEAWLANPFRLGEDYLGPVYGAQWRRWPAYKQVNRAHPHHGAIHSKLKQDGWHILTSYATHADISDVWFKEVDQLFECYTKIMKNPDDRRILMHAWNPATLDEMALVPCHLLYQFIANKETQALDLCMYQRSCDLFLGVPYNIASASALLYLMCKLTGYKPGKFVHHMADVHIYENAMDGVGIMQDREERPLPTLTINLPDVMIKHVTEERLIPIPFTDIGRGTFNKKGFDRLMANLTTDHFDLQGYDPHDVIPVEMAV